MLIAKITDHELDLLQKIYDQGSMTDLYLELGALLERVNGAIEEQNSPEAKKFREAATAETREGELEVDDTAFVSFGDDEGAYVEAWIWVSYSEAGIEKEDDDGKD